MVQNKVRTYLLYAVGEILLVVIGILIALQVNNWNEERIKESLKNEFTISMIEDLKSDLEYIEEAKIYVEQQLQQMDSLSGIVQEGNLTLRQITQLNITPNIYILSDLNNSTFNALINSGSIDLFRKELRDELIKHQGIQEDYLNSADLNNRVFYETLNSFLQSVPIYTDSWLTPAINEEVWETVEITQVALSVNALLLQKGFLLRVFQQRYQELEQSTHHMLTLLEEEAE